MKIVPQKLVQESGDTRAAYFAQRLSITIQRGKKRQRLAPSHDQLDRRRWLYFFFCNYKLI